MVFDIYAILLLFPIMRIRKIPVWLAERAAGWLTQGRVLSIVYIALVFYLLPFAGVWATRDLEIAEFYQPVVPQEVEQLEPGEVAESTSEQDAPSNAEDADSDADDAD
jgi:hypothetical protein